MQCDEYFCLYLLFFLFVFFKQKTAYEMRISDWSSDVCSSDLLGLEFLVGLALADSIGVGPFELCLQLAPDRLELLIDQRLRHLEPVRLVEPVEQYALHARPRERDRQSVV